MLTPRQQGDFGELSAAYWLASRGATLALPFGTNPHWDLIAELDGRMLRVQVKTSRSYQLGRWVIHVSTSGGNQSWNRVVKLLDPSTSTICSCSSEVGDVGLSLRSASKV